MVLSIYATYPASESLRWGTDGNETTQKQLQAPSTVIQLTRPLY